jgi:hypothetical protein
MRLGGLRAGGAARSGFLLIHVVCKMAGSAEAEVDRLEQPLAASLARFPVTHYAHTT